MRGWNFPDVWEIVAEERPDDVAVIHGERRVKWRDIDRRANAIARRLLDLGAEHQDKVAQYLYNGPEYGESMFAAFKAGLVPVNTNYRYTADELVYLWDNADAIAVMFHGTFTETIEAIRERVPGVRLWLWVDDGVGDCPSWATPYEKVAEGGDGTRTVAPWGRSGEDILMLIGQPGEVKYAERLIASLDLPRPGVSLEIWGIQVSSDEPQKLATVMKEARKQIERSGHIAVAMVGDDDQVRVSVQVQFRKLVL